MRGLIRGLSVHMAFSPSILALSRSVSLLLLYPVFLGLSLSFASLALYSLILCSDRAGWLPVERLAGLRAWDVVYALLTKGLKPPNPLKLLAVCFFSNLCSLLPTPPRTLFFPSSHHRLEWQIAVSFRHKLDQLWPLLLGPGSSLSQQDFSELAKEALREDASALQLLVCALRVETESHTWERDLA
jgi:hypothetical protein